MKSLILSMLMTMGHCTSRPNIIFFYTDDQDSELGGMVPMNKTRQWLHQAQDGMAFVNNFAHVPVCCPNRASALTGLYQHNTHVVNNTIRGNCGGSGWNEYVENRSFAPLLQAAGYKTYYAGKYHNTYGSDDSGGVEHIPPGWDQWVGFVGNSNSYYNYNLSINGEKQFYGDAPEDYVTDVLGQKTIDFLTDHLGEDKGQPFMLTLAFIAPHFPSTPAPKYENEFPDVQAPRTPAFDFSPEDSLYKKHWLVDQATTPMAQDVIDLIDLTHRLRLSTLKSVDDVIDMIMTRLESEGVLNNTYVIFSSDNGFHLGQFGLPMDKRQPYEFDIRVPLLIRGPNVQGPEGESQVLAATIDLAPTILDMAQIPVPETMDGRSLLPIATGQGQNLETRDSLLISFHGARADPDACEEFDYQCHDQACQDQADDEVIYCLEALDCTCADARNNTFHCLRTVGVGENTIYCEFEDDLAFVESYNLNSDPFQLWNQASFLSKDRKDELHQNLVALQHCSGVTC